MSQASNAPESHEVRSIPWLDWTFNHPVKFIGITMLILGIFLALLGFIPATEAQRVELAMTRARNIEMERQSKVRHGQSIAHRIEYVYDDRVRKCFAIMPHYGPTDWYDLGPEVNCEDPLIKPLLEEGASLVNDQ